ncbi:MAG TPA: hypothetical protein VND88_03510 [Candidatus Acidoferrales bacterium]|nr:hypothetical protein [Candidatus Acidoferrales bacterium]
MSERQARPVAGRCLPVAIALMVLGLSACGQSSSATAHPATTAAELKSYLATIEPIRLGVNELLNNADPIIAGFKDKKLTDAQASAQMGALEESFATYTVEVNALHPADSTLAEINAPYAHTFILEDSYLNALVNGLAEDNFDSLPDTQSDQRAAIIEWRVQLEVLAQRLHVTLPADLQQAGRGEIAPSVSGAS